MDFSFGGLYWTTHKNLGYIIGYSMIIGCLRNRNKKVREESILASVGSTLDEDTLPLKKEDTFNSTKGFSGQRTEF